ncbi:presqualene diphosphate synthase HpnD, partial [Bacteroidota bacterium]
YEKVEPPASEKSNFHYSFSFLPKDERNAINSIYAFCSYIDDIVDSTPSNDEKIIHIKRERLKWWENVIEEIYNGQNTNALIMPLIAVINRFSIPKQYFLTLIDGCRRDLDKKRYETFEELKEYCYGVAGIVGLISIEVFGHKYEETKNYAIHLGYALQLTNILRDIKSDKDRGYIYLPQEDLRRFGYSEDELLNDLYNDNFVQLMRFQAKRTREYFHKARSFLRPDERITIFAAEVMDAIYYRLLDKIELNHFNIFEKKIKVSNIHKLMIALKHWLSIRIFVSRLKNSDG